MKKNLIIFLLIIISVLFVVSAIPSIPHVLSGKVTYSSNPSLSLIGQEISASISGYNLGIVGVVKTGNNYGVQIDPQGHSGTITIYIGGIE